MNYKTKETIILTTMIIIVGIYTSLVTFYKLSPSEVPDTEQTYSKCCNDSFCTDTYYSKERNKCILSLCETSIFQFNKSKCEYDPR